MTPDLAPPSPRDRFPLQAPETHPPPLGLKEMPDASKGPAVPRVTGNNSIRSNGDGAGIGAQSSSLAAAPLPHRRAFPALTPLQLRAPHPLTTHPLSHPHPPPQTHFSFAVAPPPTPSCHGVAGPWVGDGEAVGQGSSRPSSSGFCVSPRVPGARNLGASLAPLTPWHPSFLLNSCWLVPWPWAMVPALLTLSSSQLHSSRGEGPF